MNIEERKEIEKLVLKHKLAIGYSQELLSQKDICHGDIVEASFNLAERMVERISLEAMALDSNKVEKPKHEVDPIQQFLEEMMASVGNRKGRVQ